LDWLDALQGLLYNTAHLIIIYLILFKFADRLELDEEFYVTLISMLGKLWLGNYIEKLMRCAHTQWSKKGSALPSSISKAYAKSTHQAFMANCDKFKVGVDLHMLGGCTCLHIFVCLLPTDKF
jgi:hypothetical protein